MTHPYQRTDEVQALRDSIKGRYCRELRPLWELGMGLVDIALEFRCNAPFIYVAVHTCDGVRPGLVKERTEARPSWWSVTEYPYGAVGYGATIADATASCANAINWRLSHA